MSRIHIVLLCLLTGTVPGNCGTARERADIVVTVGGGGDFRSIEEALSSLGSSQEKPVVILIRNGIYNEKVMIQRSNITLVGDDRDSTRIVYAELRENWNRDHNGSDWGAAVVNIDSSVSDITLANLTVYNNYGWQNNIFNKHQFAIRGGGTRVMLLNCKVMSDGGDALSLWNKANGMYYHADCYFEGWVDFVCPRGWCYITDSRFFGHNLSASIWHDGDADRRQKLVIRNSYFDGVPGFPLGRNHRDGQFFLLDCRFSERMADMPIYHPPSSATQWQWGDRHYYFNCHRDGGDFAWFKDNLQSAEGSPTEDEITASWTFDGKWDPESNFPSILPFACLPSPRNGKLGVAARGIVLTWVPGRNAISQNVYFGKSSPPPFIQAVNGNSFAVGDLERSTTYYWKLETVVDDSLITGKEWCFTTGR